MTAPTDRSIPDLVGDAVGQLAKLVGNEFALARAELAGKLGQGVRAMTLVATGAIVMIPALVLLLFAGASALISSGYSDPAAYVIVGGCAAVVAAIVIALGLQRLSSDALTPSVTLEQVHKDKLAAKEIVR